MKLTRILRVFSLALSGIQFLISNGQDFSVSIQGVSIENLYGVQSYAWAQHDGKWLILGGRTDGLHKRQPNQSFDQAGQHNAVLVIDPVGKQFWTSSIATLPVGIREQLQSTNMQFYQEGEHLYLTGGYGYSITAANHITYPYITAVNVPNLIQSVIQQGAIQGHFRQKTDSVFAVTGGYLNQLEGVYHLTGGHQFTGRYNPMGGPSYVQTYTEADRKFSIQDDGVNWTITHYGEDKDPLAFHRRDYNVVPQIFPGEKPGLIAFSGVFQVGADLPFLDAVLIDSSGHQMSTNFSQYYQQYHCAHLPMYSSMNQKTSTLFFGGIAQYFDSAGILVQDNAVPFVKTISKVTLDGNGTLSEYRLGVEMPGFLGASAEFIPQPDLPIFANEVVDYDQLQGDSVLLGYVFGGINSTQKNIFFINTGIESSANPNLYAIYLHPGVNTGLANPLSNNGLALQAYPNPSKGKLTVQFQGQENEVATIRVKDLLGKEIYSSCVPCHSGLQNHEMNFTAFGSHEVLFVEVEIGARKGAL
ncbi:MAG: T9SS type A sorting domain-containing protein, partial [Bacteroidota bacterium]|nr:T9SS type A sorting domain-containing protein [Bacteroidota bacterium]MDX5429995.1 T9SS type A sorting domain-containing protein [Bacteroidota bacterium]MDX5468768.1 T9SS type A sorting domain-containing protein [Bacteroidota bacterium]